MVTSTEMAIWDLTYITEPAYFIHKMSAMLITAIVHQFISMTKLQELNSSEELIDTGDILRF